LVSFVRLFGKLQNYRGIPLKNKKKRNEVSKALQDYHRLGPGLSD
jgi:hypothetical protein